MSKANIIAWIESSKLKHQQVADGYWQITLKHSHASYVLHLRSNSGWLHYGATILTYAPGNGLNAKDKFHSYVLDYNKKLNAAFLAEENEKLLLARNDFLSDMKVEILKRNVDVFHRTHEKAYPDLMREALRVGLQLVRP